MKSQWFHILVALAEGQSHGLGIVRSVLEHTNGTTQLWPATLYGSLEALVEEGLIRELDEGENPPGTSAQRRYYALTPEGRAALREEAERMGGVAALALDRLKKA